MRGGNERRTQEEEMRREGEGGRCRSGKGE